MRLSCHSHYFLMVTFLTTDLEAQAWQTFFPEQMHFRHPQLIRLSRINCILITCVFLSSLNHVQSPVAGWIFRGCDSTKLATKAFDSKQTQYECLPPKSGSEVHLCSWHWPFLHHLPASLTWAQVLIPCQGTEWLQHKACARTPTPDWHRLSSGFSWFLNYITPVSTHYPVLQRFTIPKGVSKTKL